MTETVVTQGSSATLNLLVTVAADGEPQDLTGVQVYLTVKRHYADETALLLKRTLDAGGEVGEIEIVEPQETTGNTGRATISILPADTADLSPGRYVCDVWVVLPNDEVRPVVALHPFVITPRVTIVPTE